MSEVLASVIHHQQPGQGKEEEEEESAPLELPPGFRFHPTDEEVVSHYLTPRALLSTLFTCLVVADVDLNSCEPWDLPGRAKMGEKEWYFFWHKGRKYPTGTRTNRATPTGYWKATGRDKEVFRGRGVLVGMKKTLVFYVGRAPHGEKTAWVMHEYRLEGKLPPNLPPGAKDEWAVCRVFNKDLAAKQQPGAGAGGGQLTVASPPLTAAFECFPFNDDDRGLGVDDDFTDLPPLVDYSPDFTDVKQAGGTSSSSSGVIIKTEKQQQQPAPTTTTTSACYFSMPATTSRPGYYSHPHPPQQPSATQRAPCNPVAPPAPPPPYPELDGGDLLFPLPEDFVDDYSDMWKV